MPNALPASLLALALCLGACATPPLPRAAALPIPPAWSVTPPTGADQSDPWWQVFASAELNALVARSVAHNSDVKVAAANLSAATALLRDARAASLPSGGLNAAAERRREAAAPQIAQFPELSGRFPTQTLISAGFDLAWELDLAGRLTAERAAARAAGAELEWLLRAARTEAAAATVRAWLDVRQADNNLQLLDARCAALGRIAKALAGARAAGAITAAEAGMSRAAAGQCVAEAETQHAERRNALKRLAVLGGQQFDAELATKFMQQPVPVPDRFPAIDPARALRGRADVGAAEMAARQALAQAGAARALLYPRIELAASVGTLAPPAGIGAPAALGFALGPRLVWSVFNIGRVRAGIAANDARATAALARWEGTTQRALEEADAGLERWSAAMQQQRAQCDASQVAGELASKAGRRSQLGSGSAAETDTALADALNARMACASASDMARRSYVIARLAFGSAS